MAKACGAFFPPAQDVDEDIPAIKSALIMHAKQTKCPNLAQKKFHPGRGSGDSGTDSGHEGASAIVFLCRK